MSNAIFKILEPVNEPVLDYEPGSEARALLKDQLQNLMSKQVEIPVLINGREVFTGDTAICAPPHNHRHVVGTYHRGGSREVDLAVQAAKDASHDWSRMPWNDRLAIFLRAGEMISTKFPVEK